MRILLVEDEDAIAAFVRQGLEEAGYAVDLALDGAEALHWAAIADYDIVILDLMLPDIGGLEICAELRRRGVATPVHHSVAMSSDGEIRRASIAAPSAANAAPAIEMATAPVSPASRTAPVRSSG